MTDFEKVYNALQEHAWQETYYTYDNPDECYCGVRVPDHEVHLVEEILKALDKGKENN